jgi:hypothetical protein
VPGSLAVPATARDYTLTAGRAARQDEYRRDQESGPDEIHSHGDQAGRLEDAAVNRFVGDYPLERFNKWVSDVINEVDEAVIRVRVGEQEGQAKAYRRLNGDERDAEQRRQHADPAASDVPRTWRCRYNLVFPGDGFVVDGLSIPFVDLCLTTTVLVFNFFGLPSDSHISSPLGCGLRGPGLITHPRLTCPRNADADCRNGVLGTTEPALQADEVGLPYVFFAV